MYSLEEGEKSVFQSELKRDGDEPVEENAMPWQSGNVPQAFSVLGLICLGGISRVEATGKMRFSSEDGELGVPGGEKEQSSKREQSATSLI
eukprot:2166243-Pyramimonas_sp.AAC.1